MKLDVGAGYTRREGYTRLDKQAVTEPDILWDIEEIPWQVPLEDVGYKHATMADEVYDEIMMSHIIEHVKPWLQIDVINECWRVMEPNGILRISTPCAGSWRYWQDPTHCCGWNEMTPNYFTPANEEVYKIYQPKPWKLESLVRSTVGDFYIIMSKIKE